MLHRGVSRTAHCCGKLSRLGTTWACCGCRSKASLRQHERRQIGMSNFTMMFAGLAIFLLALDVVSARAPQCCSELSSSCRHACEQLSVSGSPVGQLHQLVKAGGHCLLQEDLRKFWDCANSTIPVLTDLEAWPGRLCCDHVMAAHCKDECFKATSIVDLEHKCRQSDELGFYRCYHRQKAAEECCGKASSLSCKTTCHSIYLNDRMSSQDQQQILQQRCTVNNPQVLTCLKEQTGSKPARDPAKSLPCCERAESEQCRTNCKRILVTLTTEQQIIDELITNCGDPFPTDPMWQCFLARSETSGRPTKNGVNSPKSTMVIDGVKLQCCSKASEDKCLDLCVRTYSRRWAMWNDFHHQCLIYHPTSPLKICLDEVEEPCKFGCSGLNFCSNFNNRPSEMFRSCSAQADLAAEEYINTWQNRIINLPQMIIPVKDIRQCEPEKWKAIACSLQVKPCRGRPGPIAFCWDDCMEILTQCIDEKRLPPRQTVESLCMTLAPRDLQDQCVSIKQYLVPSPVQGRQEEVTNPCRSNPCPDAHVCQINRRKCHHPDRCPSYICKPGCNIGEVSNFMVSHNSFVRIPMAPGQLNCHEVYYCTHRGVLEYQRKMPCDLVKNCAISDREIMHNYHMKIDCNECVCQSGEVFCTKHHCPSKEVDNTAYTGLPCNCNPDQHQPVCAENGKTYPSPCLARCAGISDKHFSSGQCATSDPCVDKPCQSGYRCFKRPKVCLSLNTGPCLQYQCVEETSLCNHHHHDEVCDTSGVEYTNICLLLSHQKPLSHWGHCQPNCERSHEVCGHDGETYPHECAALASGTTVDYEGSCQAVGRLDAMNSQSYTCDKVKCHPLKPSSCDGVIPPGGCCKVCALELQLLFSEVMVEKVSRTVNNPLTVQNITSKLSEFLAIAECGVFGYLSLEGTIIVLLMPITENPTKLQLEACTHEAHRIQHFLQMSSPNVMTHLSLTPILTPLNTLRTPVINEITKSAGNFLPASLTLTLVVGVLLLSCHVILR